MKSNISKILGVGLSVIVLASMLVLSTPASAGTLAFTSEGSGATLPYYPGPGHVLDMAVAGNGSTVYAAVDADFSAPFPTIYGGADNTFGIPGHGATAVAGPIADTSIAGNQMLIKSTNSGVSWTAINTNPTATSWTSTVQKVAVAPDLADGSYVAIIQTDNMSQAQMSVSSDGGASWSSIILSTVLGYTPTNIYGLDVSRPIGTARTIAIAADGNVFTFSAGGLGGTWTNITAAPYTNFTPGQMIAVQFSPNFAGDRTLAVLTNTTSNTTTTPTVQLFNTAANAWNGLVYNGWTTGVPVVSSAAAATAPLNADPISIGTTVMQFPAATMTLSPTFMGSDPSSQVIYVGEGRNDASTGLFRVNGTFVSQIAGAPYQISSIALSAAGDKLVAGSFNSNSVIRIVSPATALNTSVTPATKNPAAVATSNTPRAMLVAYAGTNVLAAEAEGQENAFSKSTNDGNTFIDISLVNSTFSSASAAGGGNTVKDFAVSADGSKMYIVTYSLASKVMSLYRKATAWERVATQQTNATNFIVRVSPDNGDVVFVAETTGGQQVYYSNDGGYTTWTPRYSPNPILDMAVESASNVYILTPGAVSKAIDSGFIWDNPKTLLPVGMTADSIALISTGNSTGNLVVGGQNGEVAYSTDGSVTWTKVGPNIPPGGNTIAAADKLSTGGNIYAVSTTTNGFVYRFTIGTSTSWTPMMATALMTSGPNNVINTTPTVTGTKDASYVVNRPAIATGIAYSSGALYVTAFANVGTALTLGSAPGIQSSSSLYRTLNPATAALDTDWSSIQTAQEVTTASLTNPWGAYNLNFSLPMVGGTPQALRVTVGADKNPKLWGLSVAAATSNALNYPAAAGTAGYPTPMGPIQDSRSALESFVDTLVTASPALAAPPDAYIDQINTANGAANNVVFNWNPVAGTDPSVTTYRLQIALDSAFTQIIYNQAGFSAANGMPAVIGPSGSTATVPPTYFPYQADTPYYWRVRIEGPIASSFSTGRSFKIAPLSPLAIVSPAAGVSDVPVMPSFVWSPVTGATTYEIIVSDDPTFKIITFSRTSDKPEFAADEQLAYGTVYYWRVRASAPASSVTPFVNGIFTTVGKPVPPTSAAPPVTITSVPPPTVTVNLPPPVQAIPSYLLWIIIGIGAILVIALIVLVVRTRRTS